MVELINFDLKIGYGAWISKGAKFISFSIFAPQQIPK